MVEIETVTLRDPTSELTATYVPRAGMIGTSLSDDGVELLGQRRGLQAYLTAAKTMGLPILYPWANRLSGNDYGVDGAVVTLTPGTGGVRVDEHGVPIHGILAAYPDWTVTAQRESQLTAELDFGARPALLASFPFPHRLTVDVTLADRTLTVRTTVTATTGAPVPLCFGFHPYLQLPDVPRSDWVVEMPALRSLPVDDSGLPTGATEHRAATSEPLGDKALDDGYDEVPVGAVFAVSGGGRRLEVHYDEGYPAAQVFAPHSDDVVCFEPMTAPTDALRRGGYRSVPPGGSVTTQFRIVVN